MARITRHVSTERQCWVCFGTPEDEETGQMEWTSPCRCCGGTQWVHQSCLQLWVDEKQKMSSSVPVSCPQCQYMYKIQYPTSNVILYLYDHMERLITLTSPITLAGITAATLYWVSLTYGVAATTLALGRINEALEYFKTPEATVAIVCLPIVPWLILAVKILRPEVVVLRLWYRYVLPQLSRMLKYMPVTSHIGFSTRQHIFHPAEIQPLPYIARSILSMSTLPFISALIGHLFFRFTNSGIKRTLMGGVSYLCINYCIKIALEYYRGRVH